MEAVALQGAGALPRLGAPQPQAGIPRPSDYMLAVWGEAAAGHWADVAAEHLQCIVQCHQAAKHVSPISSAS